MRIAASSWAVSKQGVSASTWWPRPWVIHYDRWWNAAREDQATDRVHRIGQNKGVQVFKLVTTGTLEEKIAAVIDRKKHLMESVIEEDDPGILKSLDKEELIQLLSY